MCINMMKKILNITNNFMLLLLLTFSNPKYLPLSGTAEID